MSEYISNLIVGLKIVTSARVQTTPHKPSQISSTSNCGFSLVELLVVIAIVSILFNLTLPAVQSARESARRTQCQSQLRQLGIALQSHELSYKSFPSNGGFTPESKIIDAVGTLTNIGTEDFEAGAAYNWGIGTPGSKPNAQSGSWAYAILPFIEQNIIYQNVDFSVNVPLFLCSSRSRPKPSVPMQDNFGNYHSGGWAWSQTDYCGNARLFQPRPLTVRSSGIADGLSNTIAVGEKAYDRSVQNALSWYWDEPIFSGGSKGTARAGLVIVNDNINIPFKENWGSSHLGQANFIFADGSVHALATTIEYSVLRNLLTPHGGELVSGQFD